MDASKWCPGQCWTIDHVRPPARAKQKLRRIYIICVATYLSSAGKVLDDAPFQLKWFVVRHRCVPTADGSRLLSNLCTAGCARQQILRCRSSGTVLGGAGAPPRLWPLMPICFPSMDPMSMFAFLAASFSAGLPPFPLVNSRFAICCASACTTS